MTDTVLFLVGVMVLVGIGVLIGSSLHTTTPQASTNSIGAWRTVSSTSMREARR